MWRMDLKPLRYNVKICILERVIIDLNAASLSGLKSGKEEKKELLNSLKILSFEFPSILRPLNGISLRTILEMQRETFK